MSSLGGGGTKLELKVWERGRENSSFPVEEGNEVKDRVLETVGFQGANPICDGGGRTYRRLKGRPYESYIVDVADSTKIHFIS